MVLKHQVALRYAPPQDSVTIEQRAEGGASQIIGGCHYALHAAASTPSSQCLKANAETRHDVTASSRNGRFTSQVHSRRLLPMIWKCLSSKTSPSATHFLSNSIRSAQRGSQKTWWTHQLVVRASECDGSHATWRPSHSTLVESTSVY